jgi:hypothetical protein
MPAVEVDEKHYPLVFIKFTGEPTLDEFRAYLGRLSQLLKRPGHRALVLEASYRANAFQRKLQAEWIKDNLETVKQKTAGMAFVIQSSLVRGALTAIFWIQPLPVPYVIVATREQAEAWARQQLAAQVQSA